MTDPRALQEGDYVWWQASSDVDCDNLMDARLIALGTEYSIVHFDSVRDMSIVKTSELRLPAGVRLGRQPRATP